MLFVGMCGRTVGRGNVARVYRCVRVLLMYV